MILKTYATAESASINAILRIIEERLNLTFFVCLSLWVKLAGNASSAKAGV